MSTLTNDKLSPVIDGIKSVLAGGPDFESDLHFPVGDLIEGVKGAIPGIEEKEDDSDNGADGFSSNGWQWDWWQRFQYEGKTYILSGSGWHGGTSFSSEED